MRLRCVPRPGEVTPEGVTDNAPLPLLMTRPLTASQAFVTGLPTKLRARFHPTYAPLLEPVSLDATISLDGMAGVIFSSANGVAFAPDGGGRPAYCVGEATSAAANARGWSAICRGQTADGLVQSVLSLPPKGPLLHLSGRHVRGNIAQRLSNGGVQTQSLAIYDSRLQPLTSEASALLSGPNCVIIPLFSPRTAAHLASEAPTLAQHQPIALSHAVANALPTAQQKGIVVAKEPTAEAMCRALEEVSEDGRMG